MTEVKHEHMFGGISELKRLEEEFGIAIMGEEVPLPSKGVFYPEGHPFHKKEYVVIKTMTAREENILLNQALVRNGTVVDELIRACLVDKIDPASLLIGDRDALMVWTRLVGYGKDYETEHDCPSCNARNKYAFDLSTLDVKESSFTPVSEGVPEFEFVLPKLKRTVRFKLMTVKDERIAIDMRKAADKAKSRTGMNIAEGSLVTNNLKFLMTAFETKDGSLSTDRTLISKFVEIIPATDTLALRNHIRECTPSIDMSHWFVCPSCNYEGRITMPVGQTFFWPDLGSKT